MSNSANLSSLKRVRQSLSKLRRKTGDFRERQSLQRISGILKSTGPAETVRAERSFELLQSRYAPRPEYGYDPVSVWQRATSRSVKLVSLPGLDTPGKQILDIGTGDGVLGAVLNAFGHSSTLVDQEDWRHEPAKKVRFVAADCCDHLPFDDASFDLICSFNSFEHFPEPEKVFAEILRVVKPGGWIYLDFGPLYSSPWGLHAYRALRMPYPQFLFSEEFVREKLREIGIWDLGKKRTELQFLNQWPVARFDQLWNQATCKVVSSKRSIDESELKLVLQFPEAFRGRGLSVEDLTAASITVSIQKQ
jgi:SAM-dependent methyltransferase